MIDGKKGRDEGGMKNQRQSKMKSKGLLVGSASRTWWTSFVSHTELEAERTKMRRTFVILGFTEGFMVKTNTPYKPGKI